MKLFITSKIYDTEKQTIAEIEKAVQDDLDNMVGKDKVEFKLCTLGNVVAMFFNRPLEYSTLGADPRESIIGEDALIITGDRYNGFIMPSPLPPMPYLGHIIYNLEQSDFLEIYKESAKILGASKIRDCWLEINSNMIVLRVQMK
ncbi:hypothetical protein I6E11_12510 [Bacteroides caecigallinarum]|uniref:hypothetical protein n=1 Tax=Bacteroides caecigallinarum TaxID=1411144 RepID=UPI001F3F914D|nr:hypothetical protein [Bacteroides caecigallinarum]MCF2594596.1 hypothetical protein [Bacteroides caecigallinarum]